MFEVLSFTGNEQNKFCHKNILQANVDSRSCIGTQQQIHTHKKTHHSIFINGLHVKLPQSGTPIFIHPPIHLHTCTRTRTHTHTHTNTNTHTHRYTYTLTHTYKFAYTHTNTHTQLNAHRYTHTHTRARVRARTRIRIQDTRM